MKKMTLSILLFVYAHECQSFSFTFPSFSSLSSLFQKPFSANFKEPDHANMPPAKPTEKQGGNNYLLQPIFDSVDQLVNHGFEENPCFVITCPLIIAATLLKNPEAFAVGVAVAAQQIATARNYNNSDMKSHSRFLSNVLAASLTGSSFVAIVEFKKLLKKQF